MKDHSRIELFQPAEATGCWWRRAGRSRKAHADGVTTKIDRKYRKPRVLVYPSAIDLSSSRPRYLTRHLSARRGRIGSRWRRLLAGRQALLALAHLRCGDTYAQLAAGLGIGIATVYR